LRQVDLDSQYPVFIEGSPIQVTTEVGELYFNEQVIELTLVAWMQQHNDSNTANTPVIMVMIWDNDIDA
jgi:hypothetical protein